MEAKLALMQRLQEKVRDKERDKSFVRASSVEFVREVLQETLTPGIRAILESIENNIITLAKSANAVGKTWAAARAAAWFYTAFADAQVYTAAAPPETNLKRLVWGEIGGLLVKYPDLFSGHKVRELHIERSPQSFITGVTIPSSGTSTEKEARFSGKHAPHLLFIVDEGDAVPEEVYQGIESCMSGGFARLLVMMNPRARRGTAYRMERDGVAHVVELSALDHPNVIEGRDIIPGAVTQETTVRRINKWTRPLAPEEEPDRKCFQVPDFLVGATAVNPADSTEFPPLAGGQRKVTNPSFDYMVLGRYPAQDENQLISEEWVQAARARWDFMVQRFGEIPPGNVRPMFGLDVADEGPDKNSLCPRWGGFVGRIRIWDGVDPLAAADRAAKIFKDLSGTKINVDGTGVGAATAPYFRRKGIIAHKIMVASAPTEKVDEGEFLLLRDQLAWRAREFLRKDPSAALPPDDDLIEELLVVTYEVQAGKIRIMKKDEMKALLKRSPDRMDSFFLTFAPTGIDYEIFLAD